MGDQLGASSCQLLVSSFSPPPLGVIMSTRCGDIDPGVLAFVAREHDYNADQSRFLQRKKLELVRPDLSGRDLVTPEA